MDDVWNYQGYVAVPLEYYGRRIVGETFMSADDIVIGGFSDAMIQILTALYSDPTPIDDFLGRCKVLKGMAIRQIGEETVKKLFDEFKTLYQMKAEE